MLNTLHTNHQFIKSDIKRAYLQKKKCKQRQIFKM